MEVWSSGRSINKVEIDGVVRLDLTRDTVTPETLLSGYTAHDNSGQAIRGTLVPKAVMLKDNVAISDGLLSVDFDLRAYQAGECDCLIIETVDSLKSKAFVWTLGGLWLSTYSSSTGPSLYSTKVSVATFLETQTAHFDVELSDSGGYFYMGSVRIYGWTD